MAIDNKGIKNPMYGRKHSEETKRKIADSRSKYKKENHPQWKGGRIITPSGYVKIMMPEHHRANSSGYVFEHIVIAEQKYGRIITVKEHVHHIDHNKQNNSPDNLEVLTIEEHARLHNRPRNGVYLNCVICGKEFYRKLSHAKRGKCCSLKCVGSYTMKIRYGGVDNS